MPRVRPLLMDADPDRRLRAYDLWSLIDTVRVLSPLAKDPEETLRRWALTQLLRRQETPGAVEALELFVSDANDGPARHVAMRSVD